MIDASNSTPSAFELARSTVLPAFVNCCDCEFFSRLLKAVMKAVYSGVAVFSPISTCEMSSTGDDGSSALRPRSTSKSGRRWPRFRRVKTLKLRLRL